MYVIVIAVSFFFFKQKTAYEMRISDWSSDVCSSDLLSGLQPVVIGVFGQARALGQQITERDARLGAAGQMQRRSPGGDRAIEVDRAVLRHRGGQDTRCEIGRAHV